MRIFAFLTWALPVAAPAIRYADDPHKSYSKVHLLAYSLVLWWVDVLLAHLFFSPKQNEWTISHVLERWITEPEHSALAIPFAARINKISPNHIQGLSAVLKERGEGTVWKEAM